MVLYVLCFFLPLVQTSVVAILFQQGREKVVKEAGFSKVSTQNWYEIKKKSEGILRLLLVFWRY